MKMLVEKSKSFLYKKGEDFILNCICGYEGKNSESYCPKCQNQNFHEMEKGKIAIYELLELKEAADEIEATFKIDSAYLTEKHYTINYTISGNTVLTYDKKERCFLAQFEFFGEKVKHQFTENWVAMEDGKSRLSQCEALSPFFEKVFAFENIKLKKPSDFLMQPDGLKAACAIIKYPIMEFLPWTNYDGFMWGEYKWMNERERKMIDSLLSIESLEDFWRKGFKRPVPKSVRREVAASETKLAHLQVWHPFIKDPNNLVKLLSKIKENEKMHLFSEVRVGDTEYFEKGIQLTQNQHEDETVWVNRLLKSFRNENYFDSDRAIQILTDIARMDERIKTYIPEFKLVIRKDFEKLHDELSLLSSKLKSENHIIPYTEEERKWEEKIGDYVFLLPKDTHTLLEIGNKMNHCVGSYDLSTLKKQTTIVGLKKDDRWVGCLEVKSNRLMQAKDYSNAKLTNDKKTAVIKWAQNHSVETKNCSDL